jgi:hypothetical protein
VQNKQRTLVGLAGVLAALALQGLLGIALWGAGALRTPDTERMGVRADTGVPDANSDSRMILVQLLPQTSAEQALPSESPLILDTEQVNALRTIPGTDDVPTPVFPTADEGDPGDVKVADAVASARLAGVYESQIRARIERAWLRPRESIAEQSFTCSVLVRQDKSGYVRELELAKCNGSDRWQRSLVDAIYAASPLPAPPNPQAFVDAFSMRFEAMAYSPEAQPALYESERP